jgi:UDP-glucuronate 4-epimerase
VTIIPRAPVAGGVYDSVVTGCAGFIGSHLTDHLLAHGDRVLGIDSFEDYYARSQKERNLTAALSSPGFTFLDRDLRAVGLRRHLDAETRVFHLAAQPGVRGSWGAGFATYVDNNLLATQALLEEVVAAGGRSRVVFASSSSIYGDGPGGPTPEEFPPHPRSPYGLTKLSGEHLVRIYTQEHGLSATSLRFFTVYGPRQRPDMAFHRFFRAAEQGTPIEVYGDGRQSRDFTYVGDIVAGIAAVGDREVDAVAINLGAGEPTTLEGALRQVEAAAGRPLTIQHRPPEPGDVMATWADIRLAKRLFGFQPRVNLAEGLRRQWAWHAAEGADVAVPA